MAEADKLWIGKEVFRCKGKMVTPIKLWWHPPSPPPQTSKPSPDNYIQKRLCLWMPRRMWGIDFKCPQCESSLQSKGLYNNVRLVLDVKDYYYLAGEYMECSKGCGTFISWDQRMLGQLSDGIRTKFPALLTYKYACDNCIVSLMKSRTFGNTPTALCHKLQEIHSEEWLRKQLHYLSDCERHKSEREKLGLAIPEYDELPPFRHFPTPKWFLAVYLRDVWFRLPSLLAEVTSVFGSILKIDSTKKICRKLQGNDANTADWATSVGNERGEVLISVLTASESNQSLQRMADGLVQRYKTAGREPPQVLYTDRDCCSTTGKTSRYHSLFHEWNSSLQVRLDIWHFMRRFSRGMTSEAHPLHGEFMGRLSNSIFEWDMDDVSRLIDAKRGEMIQEGVENPNDLAVRKAIKREELAKHCKRRTRGTDATIAAIGDLISSFSSATDTAGHRLFSDNMQRVWAQQQIHIDCIQDPPGVKLYAVTGHIVKGGVQLPVFRCARGTTSLESFHLHLARFIPGTSANAVNFQAYLLDGITRWNSSRASNATRAPQTSLRTFDSRLQGKVNALSQSIHGKDIIPLYRPPSKFTEELFGVEYLYHQSGTLLQSSGEDLESQIEKGLSNVCIEETEPAVQPDLEERNIAVLPGSEVCYIIHCAHCSFK